MHQPWALVLILAGLEAGILFLAQNPRTRHCFRFLPPMFWIYFLPMVLASLGIIDSKSPLYSMITQYLLPPALFLLLLDVDIKAIVALGPVALVMFFTGSCGIVLGMIVSFIVFQPLIGSQFWSGFGALSASWTGGVANMVAVKEALNTSDAVFMPMVIVDTVVPYIWLGILMTLAPQQSNFDRWNHANPKILEALTVPARHLTPKTQGRVDARKAVGMIVLAFLIGYLAKRISVHLPTATHGLSPYAWSIIIVAMMAVITTMTPLALRRHSKTNQTGKWLLYFVLMSIGARATFHNAAQAGILIIAGVLVIGMHALLLIAVARLMRAPLFLIVTASLANIAGLASAPMVAEVYQPGFAGVGLLLAILGHTLGAYIGIFTGQVCRLFIHL